MESINHHSQFLCFPGTNTFLNSTGMRPMRDTGGMQRDHSSRNVFATHEITIYIVYNFIAVYITMIIWCRNRHRVIIKQARTERANDEIVRFERLVNRRRLVHSSRYRFKIVNGECKWITIAIPTYYIEWMCAVMESI